MKSKLLLTTAIVGMTAMSAANASNTIMGALEVSGIRYNLAPQTITASRISFSGIADGSSSTANPDLTLNSVNIIVKDTLGENLTYGTAFPTRDYFTNPGNFRLNANNEVEYSATPADESSWTVVKVSDGTGTPAGGDAVNGGPTLNALGGVASATTGVISLGATNLSYVTTTGNNSIINTVSGGTIAIDGVAFNVNGGSLTLQTVNTAITTNSEASFNLLNGATLSTGTTIINGAGAASVDMTDGSSLITNIASTFLFIDTVNAEDKATITPTFTGIQLAGLTVGEDLDLGTFNIVAGSDITIKNDMLTLEKDPTSGVITITDIKTLGEAITSAGGSNGSAAFAEFLDELEIGEISDAYVPYYSTLINELYGQVQAGARGYSDELEALNPVANSMMQILATGQFDALGNAIFGNTASAVNLAAGDNGSGKGALWVQGLYDNASLDDTNNSHGFDADSYGFAIGGEMNVNKDVKVGLAYSYTYTEVDGFNRTTDVDTSNFALYAQYKPTEFYVNAMLVYGIGSYEEEKSGLGTSVTADYDADSFGFEVAGGKEFAVSGFAITPEASLRYLSISPDKYTDTAGLSIDADSVDVFTAGLSVKASKPFAMKSMTITPQVKLGLSYDLSSDEASSLVTIAGSSSSYTVRGDELNEFAFDFGLGVMADIGNNMELGLNYEGQFRSDYQDHAGMLKFKYNF